MYGVKYWDVAKAQQLYEQGQSLAVIALAMGVSRAEIAAYERKWWRRPARPDAAAIDDLDLPGAVTITAA